MRVPQGLDCSSGLCDIEGLQQVIQAPQQLLPYDSNLIVEMTREMIRPYCRAATNKVTAALATLAIHLLFCMSTAQNAEMVDEPVS